MLHATREEWLEAAAARLACLLPAGYVLPPLKLSVGFPKGARGGHAIGQCWAAQCAADGKTAHIYVSPEVHEAVEACRVLLHELVHAIVGAEARHKGAFIKLARALGFEAPWTRTPASAGLMEHLTHCASELGAYPHVQLCPPLKAKGKSRLLLYECACGRKVRAAGTQEPLRARCLDCGTDFQAKVKGGE